MEGTFRSWVEGPSGKITKIENAIRKYCFSNNIEIVDLHSESSGFLQKTCFFDLKGDVEELTVIKKNLEQLAKIW